METKKLSQEELKQIQDIQNKNQAIIVEFGQIELIKLSLEERVQNAKEYLVELKSRISNEITCFNCKQKDNRIFCKCE